MVCNWWGSDVHPRLAAERCDGILEPATADRAGAFRGFFQDWGDGLADQPMNQRVAGFRHRVWAPLIEPIISPRKI
jgi:hypothetical protein